MRWVREKYIERFGFCSWVGMNAAVDGHVQSALREYDSSNAKEESS